MERRGYVRCLAGDGHGAARTGLWKRARFGLEVAIINDERRYYFVAACEQFWLLRYRATQSHATGAKDAKERSSAAATKFDAGI